MVYYAVALVGIAMFGANLQSSILLNFGFNGVNPNTGNPYWECYVIQFSFMVVLLCHIPFIFYGGKEGLCILVDEAARRSISNVLFVKLQATNDAFAQEVKEKPLPNPDLKLPFEEEFELKVEQENLKDSFKPDDIRSSAINALSIVPQAQANRMAYKDMKTSLYLLCTFGLFAFEMGMGVLISDISIVFEFASAIAVSALAFWFPGYYYLMAAEKYGKDKPNAHGCVARVLFYFGWFNCFIGMSAAVINVIEHISGNGGSGH